MTGGAVEFSRGGATPSSPVVAARKVVREGAHPPRCSRPVQAGAPRLREAGPVVRRGALSKTVPAERWIPPRASLIRPSATFSHLRRRKREKGMWRDLATRLLALPFFRAMGEGGEAG